MFEFDYDNFIADREELQQIYDDENSIELVDDSLEEFLVDEYEESHIDWEREFDEARYGG